MESELLSFLSQYEVPGSSELRASIRGFLEDCGIQQLKDDFGDSVYPVTCLIFMYRLSENDPMADALVMNDRPKAVNFWCQASIDSTNDPAALNELGYLFLQKCRFENLPACEADYEGEEDSYFGENIVPESSITAAKDGPELPFSNARKAGMDLALKAFGRAWYNYYHATEEEKQEEILGREFEVQDAWRAYFALDGLRAILMERREAKALNDLFADYNKWRDRKRPIEEPLEIQLNFKELKGYLAGRQEGIAGEVAENVYAPRQILASQEQMIALLNKLPTQGEELRKEMRLLLEAVINAQSSEGLAKKPKTRLYELLNHIEQKLLDLIRGKLIRKFGGREEDWWVQGIPLNVREKCATRREEDPKRLEVHRYMDLIDLRTILDKNWAEFQMNFVKLNPQYPSKAAFLSDFLRINEIRRSIMHPIRTEEISQDDLQFAESFFKTTEIFAQ